MVILKSHETSAFRVGIRKRIFSEGETDLLSVYGCLCSIGRTSFSYIFVNSKDPDQVTAIIIRSCTGAKLHIDVALSKNPKEIFETWMETMDKQEGIDNSNDVFCWFRTSVDSNLKFLKDNITLKADMSVLASSGEVLSSFEHLDTTLAFKCGAKAYIAYKTDSKPISYVCPDGYSVKLLSMVEAEKALSTWKFRSAGSAYNRLFLSSIQGLAVGVVHNQSGALVSWIFGNWDGSMSALSTVKEHQRKGLAKVVVGKMCEIYDSHGISPFVYIEAVEGYSDALFTKLGFVCKRDQFFYWGVIYPKT